MGLKPPFKPPNPPLIQTPISRIPFDEEVAYHYMQYFNFDNYKLDDAVRVFVERAPLIGNYTLASVERLRCSE